MKKKKNPYLELIVLVLIIALVNFSPFLKYKTKSAIYRLSTNLMGSLSLVGEKFDKAFSFVFDIGKLKKNNEALSLRIMELQIDESRINELENENKLLKQELGFLDKNNQSALVPARIVDRDPITYLDYLIVDKGKNENILVNMAVVSNGILIGQISEVYDTTSKVNLITSRNSIVQAMLQDSRSKGVLKGGISGLYLDNIVSDTEYKEGEYVVTSGLGGDMKEGILIGRAGKIQSFSTGIYKSISVEPLVELSNLELVFIQK
jgi:rod shape-determining protein MreC